MDKEEIQQIAYDYTTCKDDAKKLEDRILSLFIVSQQSELLAFRKWQKDNWKDVYLYSNDFMIREFKKANCG